MEILDDKGAVVRRYASSDQPEPLEKLANEYPIPMYWVRPPQILSGQPGMHRFVWDLHYAPPQALEYEFPIAAILRDTVKSPLGAWAMPGEYTVRLIVEGQSHTQPLRLVIDPRIKTPLEELRKQFEMQAAAVEGMNNSYESLEQVQSVRSQLADLAPKTKANAKLSEAVTALDKQCASLAGATETSFYGLPPSGRKPENFSTLNQHFATILAVADSADAAPTTQAQTALQQILEDETPVRAQWTALRDRDIPNLNKLLKKSKLPEIDPTKPLAEKLGGASQGDDEP